MRRSPFAVEAIREQSAKDAFDAVVKHVGASYKRDAIDQRIVSEVCKGTASFGKKKDGIIDSQQDVGGWPILKSLPAPADADSDGIADVWEKKHKLNSSDPSDAVKEIEKIVPIPILKFTSTIW